jgi:hypothetical protein
MQLQIQLVQVINKHGIRWLLSTTLQMSEDWLASKPVRQGKISQIDLDKGRRISNLLNIAIAISLVCFHGHHSLTVKFVKVPTLALAILLQSLYRDALASPELDICLYTNK